MEEIRHISSLIQAFLFEIGAIATTVIGVIGIVKLMVDQIKQNFGK